MIAAAAARVCGSRKGQDLIAAILLLGLMTVIHGDVMFRGKSVVQSNFYNPFDPRPLADNYGDSRVPPQVWTERNLSPYANLRDPGATWWQWEPSTIFLATAIRTMEWPLWDPYVAAGTPAMANLIPAFFFPPYTALVALGTSVGLKSAYCLALLWGASFFTYLFLRRHSLTATASVGGATLVLFSGGLNQNLGSFMGQTACCLPVAAFATRAFFERPSWRRTAGLAVVYAAVALASFPPLLVAMFGILTCYALTAILVEPGTFATRRRYALLWGAAAVLSVGLVAFYYGPAMAVRQDAPQVPLLYHEAALEIMPVRHILQLLSPTVLGGVQVYMNGPFANQLVAHLSYVGGVAVLCTLLSGPTLTRRVRTLWISSSVAAVLILLKVFGVPPVHWIGYVRPFNQIHMAFYFGVPLGFLVAGLAAIGFDKLLRNTVSLARTIIAVAVVMIALGLLRHLASGLGVFSSIVSRYVSRDWLVVAGVTLTASIVALIAASARSTARQRQLAVACLVGLASVEGIYNNWYPKPARWDVFEHPVPFMKLLRDEAAHGRVYGFGVPYANLNEAFDVSGLDSLMAFNPPRIFDLYRTYAGAPLEAFLRGATQLPPENVLDRANVAFIGTFKGLGNIEQIAAARHYRSRFNDGYTIIYERATPRRFFYSSEYRVVSQAEALAAIATAPPREIVLESSPGVAPATNLATDPLVHVEAYRRNSVTVTVDAPRPGLVYASESYFPGWTARVNGQDTPILPANYAFRAVPVPAGHSRVEFRYWPSGLTSGLTVSGVSLLVVCGLMLVRSSQAASSQHAPPPGSRPADAGVLAAVPDAPLELPAATAKSPAAQESTVPRHLTNGIDRFLIPSPELLFDGSGSEEDFVVIGGSFCQNILIQRAYLPPTGVFLDIGCGNGSIARYLASYFTPQGRYEGLDIHPAGIAWLEEHYQAYPNFHFTLANVHNKAYNADGQFPASQYRFPYDDATFDMLLLKSVFTHMLPGDLRNYLNECGRVLKPGGRAVITFFLLNDDSRSYIAAGFDKMGLVHQFEDDPLCRVGNPAVPEAVVAHDESRVRQMYAQAGFSLAEVMYGDWCGRQSLMGLQDFIVAIKELPGRRPGAATTA